MMETTTHGSLSRRAVVEMYFLEHRARLLDVAAFLDRVDRAGGEGEAEDFRMAALRQAVAMLDDGQGQRVRRMLELFSDHSSELPQSATDMKGALGAAPTTHH